MNEGCDPKTSSTKAVDSLIADMWRLYAAHQNTAGTDLRVAIALLNAWAQREGALMNDQTGTMGRAAHRNEHPRRRFAHGGVGDADHEQRRPSCKSDRRGDQRYDDQ